ncbi:J domain-containing protein [endosymbiont GvMRE of Glomus versiforme]|uniref:J domain-containing protein n=1 Tax=endosymbiont GvMRE of Glomus versiforme TaxID=2039283 RepID=UPI001C0EFC1C|nr:J domain-containing protein [endosymbiont GvMRE of Glomus versiforme]
MLIVPYETLGLSEGASEEEIKEAYKRLALKWHPDKNPDNKEEAKKKFQEILRAKQILLKSEDDISIDELVKIAKSVPTFEELEEKHKKIIEILERSAIKNDIKKTEKRIEEVENKIKGQEDELEDLKNSVKAKLESKNIFASKEKRKNKTKECIDKLNHVIENNEKTISRLALQSELNPEESNITEDERYLFKKLGKEIPLNIYVVQSDLFRLKENLKELKKELGILKNQKEQTANVMISQNLLKS